MENLIMRKPRFAPWLGYMGDMDYIGYIGYMRYMEALFTSD